MNGLTDAIVFVAGFVVLALILRAFNDSAEPDPDRETAEPRLR